MRIDRLMRFLDLAAPTVGLLGIGLVGGVPAALIGLPMPFLIGGLASTAAYAMLLAGPAGRPVIFPQRFRMIFVAVIGAMIGASFSADLVAAIPSLWLSLGLMIPFVLVSFGLAFALFHHVGGYDRVTAIYAAMPGGLVEAVSLGEQAGADMRLLGMQHFARIVLVVVTVPLMFYLWSGQAVGSAGGQSLGAAAGQPATLADIIVILLLAALGQMIGPYLRLPAAHLTGPLILSAVLHATGLVQVASPAWLLGLAQLVIGTGLGAIFAGATGRQLGRAFGLGMVSVALILAVGLGFAAVLSLLTPAPGDALFISFAPGGVTEMGLIALSLNLSPVFVSVHHLFRIFLTVSLAAYILKRQLAAPR